VCMWIMGMYGDGDGGVCLLCIVICIVIYV
jgi:hypothetical protein